MSDVSLVDGQGPEGGSARVRRTCRDVGGRRVGGSRFRSVRKGSSQRGRCGSTRCTRSIAGGREKRKEVRSIDRAQDRVRIVMEEGEESLEEADLSSREKLTSSHC
jgi:hypothetical protein